MVLKDRCKVDNMPTKDNLIEHMNLVLMKNNRDIWGTYTDTMVNHLEILLE